MTLISPVNDGFSGWMESLPANLVPDQQQFSAPCLADGREDEMNKALDTLLRLVQESPDGFSEASASLKALIEATLDLADERCPCGDRYRPIAGVHDGCFFRTDCECVGCGTIESFIDG